MIIEYHYSIVGRSAILSDIHARLSKDCRNNMKKIRIIALICIGFCATSIPIAAMSGNTSDTASAMHIDTEPAASFKKTVEVEPATSDDVAKLSKRTYDASSSDDASGKSYIDYASAGIDVDVDDRTVPSIEMLPTSASEYADELADIDMSDGITPVVEAAISKLGSPYVYASHGPDTFSCDGFTDWCYTSQGIKLYDGGAEDVYGQFAYLNKHGWITTDIDDLKPGAVLFFGAPDDFSHAALYVGRRISDGAPMIIHATSGTHKVDLNVYDGSASYGGMPGLVTPD